MKKLNVFLILLIFTSSLLSCKENTKVKASDTNSVSSKNTKVMVQGHRGDRGNFPENSIPAFISAVKKGVQVVELDLTISKDRQVVVSHEPYMHHAYMLQPNGTPIAKEDEKSFNLYKMPYDSIKKFDLGSKGNINFPNQLKQKTFKPLLSEVIDTLNRYRNKNQLPGIKYNIEIKSIPAQYGIYQPHPEDFVNLVMKVVKEKNIVENVNLQSFDIKILEVINRMYPSIEVAYLVTDGKVKENLSKLSFLPEIYSPHYKLISDIKVVKEVHELGMKIIPWTINQQQDIERMKRLGVDGIITDYPERAL